MCLLSPLKSYGCTAYNMAMFIKLFKSNSGFKAINIEDSLLNLCLLSVLYFNYICE